MHNGQPHDPSRKGKGGPYGPKRPGGGTNPFKAHKKLKSERPNYNV